MKIRDLETAIIAALLPMQDKGFRVANAPTDSEQTGRVFGKGEIRAAWQSRTWDKPGRNEDIKRQEATLVFEVVIELQGLGEGRHPDAGSAVEDVVDLIWGLDPAGDCTGGLYPQRDGFTARDSENALWIYTVIFGLKRTYKTRK